MAKMIDVEPLIIAVESAYRLASSYGLEGTAEEALKYGKGD